MVCHVVRICNTYTIEVSREIVNHKDEAFHIPSLSIDIIKLCTRKQHTKHLILNVFEKNYISEKPYFAEVG